MPVKDIIKLEVRPVNNGFVIEAHGDNKGKVVTQTFACESAASAVRRLTSLIKKLEVPADALIPFG